MGGSEVHAQSHYGRAALLVNLTSWLAGDTIRVSMSELG